MQFEGRKKNERTLAKPARAKTPYGSAAKRVGDIEYEDPATFQRRNEALLPDAPTAEWSASFGDAVSGVGGKDAVTDIGLPITPRLGRRLMRRRLRGVMHRLLRVKRVHQLPKKSRDLSRYMKVAGLTSKQKQCFSLKFEYSMSERGIAYKLKLSRRTVRGHLKAAEKNMTKAWHRRRTGAPMVVS